MLYPRVADERVFSFADCILDVVKASLPWLREQLAVLESEQGFDLKNATIQQVLSAYCQFLKKTRIMVLRLHSIIFSFREISLFANQCIFGNI